MKQIPAVLLCGLFLIGCGGWVFKNAPTFDEPLGKSKASVDLNSILEPRQLWVVKKSITGTKTELMSATNTIENGRITKITNTEMQHQLKPGDKVYVHEIVTWKGRELLIGLISQDTYDVTVPTGLSGDKASETESRRVRARLGIPLNNRQIPDIAEVEKTIAPFIERVQ